MGCDEHFYLEVKQGGKWIAEKPTPYAYGSPGEERVPQFDITGGRNYAAYAVLADVRNGHGFAGIDTGNGFKVISEPKGLPKNVSKEIKAISDEWDADGHSHTWLTLKELRDFEWWRTSTMRGVLEARQYAAWRMYDKANGRAPDSYSGAIWGQSIVTIDMNVADHELDLALKRDAQLYWAFVRGDEGLSPPFTHVKAQWEEPYTEAVGHLYTRGIPALQKIQHDLGLTEEEVRIVGFFDN